MQNTERALRHAAAVWGAALLVDRPGEALDRQEALVSALDAFAKGTPQTALPKSTPQTALWFALWAALERDDEDTDETARRLFAALGRKGKPA